MKMKRTLLILAIPTVALLATSFFFAIQEAEAQSGTRRGKQAHYDALWGWIQRAKYTKWNGADGTPPVFEEGQSPHGALIKTYVSAKAATNLNDPPHGTVIVKENYSPDKRLMAITVMHRSTGYDPKHGDWYYAKYMPTGKIAKTPPEMKSMPIAGKFKMCIECHSGAGGKDFAFFND
jgi:hypothetical protein